MTVCVISQPRLFPGPHYLARMLLADVFVVFDSVQYNPRHEENRARVKAAEGPQWLSVPMNRNGRDQLIVDTTISDQPWQDKALRTLKNLYSTTPFFDENIDRVESILRHDHHSLTELDIASWQPALEALQPDVRFVRSSELSSAGTGSALLANICTELDATTYVSGGFGRDYLDHDLFESAGIEVDFHDYEPLEYPQLFGEFAPYLSYLDMLFNVGLDRDLIAGS